MKTSVKSKKQIALLSAGALLSLGIAATAGGLTASAATQNLSRNEGDAVQQGVTITHQITEAGWKATVDDSVTLSGGRGTIEFTFSDVVLDSGKSLSVKASSGNDWKLKDTSNNEIEYDVKKSGASIKDGGTVLSDITGASEELSASLDIEVTGKAKFTGSYTDTLTFTITES